MIRCRLRVVAYVFLIPLLHADVTLRYKTEIKMNPTLPAQMTGAMGGADAIVPQDRVLQLKAGKGFSTAAGYNSITDFTTQEITLLDATTSRYAKLKASQLGGVLAGAAPKIPAEALAAMSSLKTDVSPREFPRSGRFRSDLGRFRQKPGGSETVERSAMENFY